MLTSMFRKVFVSYMSVMLLAFSFLTFVAHIEIKHVLTNQRLQVLNQEAEDILPIIERVNGNPKLVPAFDNVVSRYKRLDNATVNLLLVRNSNLKKIERLTNQLVSHNDLLNDSAVQQVLSGKSIQLVGPFSKSIRESTLIVGVPIESNGVVIGALFLHTPVQELRIGQVTQIIILLAIPILLLSMCILYLTSRRFSRPLLQMNKAVQSIGEGHFGERITVSGKDEVSQLAMAFNEMSAQLESLEIMRKDLIANVSHEIRTPLTSVKGFIQGILDGVIPASEQKRYLETANVELQRLSTLLNSMLDLSSIETGRIAIHSDVVVWQSIVDTVVERVHVRASEKDIQLRQMTSDATVTVWGDSERLIQILLNLVDNAIRHTTDGEISISSTVAEGHLHVWIQDTGEGIAKDVLPHIWERFYTGVAARSSAQARSGLGLTITKHLVELMNGRIEVESTSAVGTTFILHFPLFSASSYS